MQQTHVLSACYRFIGLLSEVVPRIHIVLGNHDLAYRRDYQTTALDALNISRLAPYVSVHSSVSHHEWDGRRVLLLPFREEQDELTKAVDSLPPSEANETVAFAHLAINKAITQRYVATTSIEKPRVANSITYRGLTGPDRFASLARTFTGHFHSHQTIIQERFDKKSDLQGSLTYLGSPLQLGWADLYDEQRGVVLFDPKTLEHELLINPHGIGYTTVELQQVLDGQVDEATVVNKHVMLLGDLTHFKYATARDKLLSLGVRGVRRWTPLGFALNTDGPSLGLGTSVPTSDASVQPLEEPADETAKTDLKAPSHSASDADPDTEPAAKLDLAAEAREYVESLELDESLLSRRDELVRVGQRLLQVSSETADQDGEAEMNHRDFLDRSSQALGTRTTTEPTGLSTHVFVAEPFRLTMTNFLGVQGTITIDFRQDLKRGLTFLVGDNGSGKSTLVEAMVWCQFGRCIRNGLSANDVVNDSVRNNCSVTLEFANGYAISRYRKDRANSNRLIVSLHGEPQPQFEHPDSRTRQAAIDELLGINYETYVRTVVLGHESAISFLSSSPAQRRDLVEATLGLSMLDQYGQVSRLVLKDVDKNVAEVEGKLDSLNQTMEYINRRVQDLNGTQKRLEEEAEEGVASLEVATQKLAAAESLIHSQAPLGEEYAEFVPEFDPGANDGQQIPADELSVRLRLEVSKLQAQMFVEQENLQRLERSHALMRKQKAESQPWLSRLQQQLSQRLEAMALTHPVGLQKLLHAANSFILSFRLTAIRALLRVFKTSNDNARRANQEAAIDNLHEDMGKSTSRLQSLEHKTDRVTALENQASNHAVMLKKQLAQADKAQKECDALRHQVTLTQREAATYTQLVEDEQSSLHSLRLEHSALDSKRTELATDREVFAFWASALTKRARRTSSSPAKSTAKLTGNFREHVLAKSLSELNTLLTQVLATLYDDTRHARAMTTGMLRSLFDSDSNTADASSGTVLDRSLAVQSSLAYGKRSGGERKRVDLALFFALLQLSWARSSHRAHYLLVDEVFDSLDEAGQAAVVRWCGLMSKHVAGWIVVITHSRFLVERDLEEAGKVLVVRARMGEEGTELLVDGERIGEGVRDEDS